MPRPKDLGKAVLLPATFGIGALAAGGTDQRTVLRVAVVLAAVELLVYAARYQWNDARGFVADQRHPHAVERGRLPGPLGHGRRNVSISCAVAVGRLLVVALLIRALPQLALWPLLGWATLGVFGVAVAYEVLRSIGTGRTDQVPPPVGGALVLIWVTVGAGYAVRGLVGFALAMELSRRPILGLAAGLTLWSGGVLFVTTRWAVEATAFGRVRHGQIRWSANAGHAREHLLALARWLPSTVRTAASTDDAGAPLTAWAPLRGRTPLSAPWHVALLVGGAAAGLTGSLLAGQTSPVAAGGAAALGLAAALAVATAGRSRRRWLATLAGSLVLGVFLLAMTGAARTPQVIAGVLPWLALNLAYLRFIGRALRPAEVSGAVLRRVGRRVLGPPARLVLGRPTWEVITEGGRR